MNRNLVFIALALFTWGMGEGMFINFQPIYLAQLGSNPQQIGLILGAFGVAMAVTHIPAGHLADRVGRRPLLIAAWAIGFLATLGMAIARTLPFFVLGMLGYGITAFVSSPLNSYVTVARGEWSVSRTLTLTSATYSTGMILGPLSGGWVGDHFGLRTVYFVSAAIFFVSLVLLSFIGNQPLNAHDPDNPPPSLLTNTRFVTFVSVMALAVFAMYLAQPLTPNYLRDVRALSLSQIGLVFTAGALGNVLVNIFVGRLDLRVGYALSQALVGFFALLIWRGTALPFYILGYLLLGGFRAARPLAMAQVRELIHESQMGLTFGLMETINAIIYIVTPPLAGFLFERDPNLPYPFALGLVAVSITLTLILIPRVTDPASQPFPADN